MHEYIKVCGGLWWRFRVKGSDGYHLRTIGQDDGSG